jgi:exonuclease III
LIKCFSFNCRGLVVSLKRPSLKRVIDSEHLDILLLQEKMGEGEEVKYRLISLLRGWNFESLGSTQRYRGLYIGWNTRSIKVINSWGFKSGIGITILSLKLEDPLNIFNIYDPCQNRGPYWDKIFSKSFLKYQQVILGGDLKFSLGFSEVWGTHVRVDPLTNFFNQKMVECNLLDIEPIKLKPTRRNNIVGDSSVAKRLDHFLIKDTLLEKPLQLKQWISYGGISDHCPNFLEIRKGSNNPPIPFKCQNFWCRRCHQYGNLIKSCKIRVRTKGSIYNLVNGQPQNSTPTAATSDDIRC